MPSRMIQVVLAVALAGFRPDATSAQVPGASAGATVSGAVHDSLAAAPLAGALVQLVDMRHPTVVVRSAVTSARGEYVLEGVPDGRYQLGFLHPILDSLGIAPRAHQVTVDRSRPVVVDLAVPSAARLRNAYCGSDSGAAGAVFVGVVRRAADHAAVAGARVQADWMEYAITGDGIASSVARRSTVARPAGWFILCAAPHGGTIVVSAEDGAERSGRVEIEMPKDGFLRRDLIIGARVDGRLSGVVVGAQGGHAVAGAIVTVSGGGPEARTDAHGQWVLTGVPVGTHTLEVRAIGYLPGHAPVDVVAAAAPVKVALLTIRAALDTVRVRASRVRLTGTGFDDRARSGAGRYMTAEYIARRRPNVTSDLLRTVPGIRLDRGTLGETQLTVRGPFGRCAPAVYIDGHHMRGLSAEDVDSWAHPDDIAGIEIYAGALVPPEFQEGMTGCGSIVIWTKPFNNPARRWSWARRTAQGAGAMLLGAAVGVLLTRM